MPLWIDLVFAVVAVAGVLCTLGVMFAEDWA